MTGITSPTAPSHIFIVRHGARLDMADSQWAQSSPTPYDTPLTYGGWIQSRNVGARIAALLHANHHDPSTTQPPPRNTKRIILHSSPFLRCIQTSISIASGIAGYLHEAKAEFEKPSLRFDAWLGEWMTPDYYTEIAPPPPASLMISDAKNEYLRSKATDHTLLTAAGAFVAPIPAYPISLNGTTPPNYIAHAMEYVDLDHAWNSTRLGDGADLGEEWSAMHKRFRAGYQRLMDFYTAAGREMQNISSQSPEFEAEKNTDTVVIMVTHGAGCNALLGAITDKPVLIDIGTASITMGVLRKPQGSDSSIHYDLKLVANTEHLRPSATGLNTLSPRSGFNNSIVIDSSGDFLANASNRSQRSASTGNGGRPNEGLWTMPRPEDRVRPTRQWDLNTTPDIPSVEAPMLERSGATLDGGKEGLKGLWAARGWQNTSKRRWTVGREASMGE